MRHRLLLALLVLVGAAPAAALQVQEPVAPESAPQVAARAAAVPETAWTAEEEAAIQLLRSLRKKERPSDQELAAQLSRPGPQLLSLFFEVFATRRVPAFAGDDPQMLSEIQERVIWLACEQLEREPVLAHVDAALLAGVDLGRRAASMALIGSVGRANDLPQLFALALADEETAIDKRLAKALRQAVTALVGRDPRAIEQLVTLRRITRPELLPVLVEAVGVAGDARGLAYLSEIAYWSEGLILEVMSQVPLLGPSGDAVIDTALRVRLRSYLDESRPGLCRAAITALTSLGDADAIAAMIPLLESENQGLRENAHWALRQLTGLTLAPSAEVWGRWHQGEQYWCLRNKAREFQRLRRSNPAEVADALRTILAHPLARDELASALPDLLKSPWPTLRVLACRTLGDLSSKAAVGRLVWALEDSDPEVVTAAHAALRKLTQLDLPREAIAWQVATQTDPSATEL